MEVHPRKFCGKIFFPSVLAFNLSGRDDSNFNFFHSFLINRPALIQLVLQQRPDDFPKSSRITTGLYSLLGESVFLTTVNTRQRQRRIVNPAFEGRRLKQAFPVMQAAADAFLAELSPGTVDVEPLATNWLQM